MSMRAEQPGHLFEAFLRESPPGTHPARHGHTPRPRLWSHQAETLPGLPHLWAQRIPPSAARAPAGQAPEHPQITAWRAWLQQPERSHEVKQNQVY